MTNRSEHVTVVIGAGMAGLAAARQLILQNMPVVVLEKNSHAGGRIHTDLVNGFEIETGAQFMANFYHETRRLISELGLKDEIVNIRAGVAVERARRLYKLWPGLNILFTNLIPFWNKLDLVKTLGPLLRYWQKLDIHALYKADPLDNSSISDYAYQKLNDELLEYVIGPPLSSIFYWTPEHTSQAMFFGLLKLAFGMELFTLRHGLQQLPKAMAKDLSIHYDTEVIHVTGDESNKYTIETNVDGQKRWFTADGIVCAIPGTSVPKIFGGLNSKQRNFFDGISYSATVATAIGSGRRLPSDFYGLFYPRREVTHLGTAVIQSAKNPGQIPAGRDLITLFSTGLAAPEMLDKDDEVIRNMLLADLRMASTAYDPTNDELFYRVYRHYEAVPKFDVGHFKRLNTFSHGEIELGYVVFAGDYLGGPFIEGAVTSGLEAANRLLQRLRKKV